MIYIWKLDKIEKKFILVYPKNEKNKNICEQKIKNKNCDFCGFYQPKYKIISNSKISFFCDCCILSLGDYFKYKHGVEAYKIVKNIIK